MSEKRPNRLLVWLFDKLAIPTPRVISRLEHLEEQQNEIKTDLEDIKNKIDPLKELIMGMRETPPEWKARREAHGR